MNREDALLDLFIHPGWQIVMDEMREAHEVLVKTTHHLETEKDLFRRKGEIQKLSELLALPDLVKMQLAEEALTDAED